MSGLIQVAGSISARTMLKTVKKKKKEEEEMKQPGCISEGRGKINCKPENLAKCVKQQMACKTGAEGEQMGII